MLENLRVAAKRTGLIADVTEPAIQPRQGEAFKLHELLRGADVSKPNSKIERFPIDARLSAVDRAINNKVAAEAAVERCQLHLNECEKHLDVTKRELQEAQDRLYVELVERGAFEGVTDLTACVKRAMVKAKSEPDAE